MECVWEPLVEERKKEKLDKYRMLAADIRRREPQWWVSSGAIVIGTLESICKMRQQLTQLNLWTDSEITKLMGSIQYQTLCTTVQVLRRLLSSKQQ